MFKRFAIKKSIIIFSSLLVLFVIYLFPKNDNYKIYSTVTYKDPKTMPIYLIDNNNLVSRFEVIQNSNDVYEIIDEVIENLTVNNKNKSYLPNNFKPIIPKDTVILSKELKDGLLKINFSKELLNIEQNNEEKLIESIIYSLTEIKEVNKIMIFVNDVNLTKLPSGKTLPNTLDRTYGINKIYDIKSMNNISKITTYYVSKYEDITYYTPVTYVSNEKNEKVKVIIENLKTSPTYQTNLMSYLASSAELQNYEILENSINLSFNNEILNLDNNKITEEVKYSIALSMKDNYNVEKTIFFVDDLLIDVLFI